jgi:hypothetical protein
MGKRIFYLAVGISAVLLAAKFAPSFVRELRLELM